MARGRGWRDSVSCGSFRGGHWYLPIRNMITGILLIGLGFALGYRRIQKTGTAVQSPTRLPVWLKAVGRAVSIETETIIAIWILPRCFSCSHTVLPKEHSLGVFFFSSLSSCKCCIFLQFYLHFTTDYTCMIVYVTNNKEPWTLDWVGQVIPPDGKQLMKKSGESDFVPSLGWYSNASFTSKNASF